jgi:hypothetical protein
MQMLAIGWQFLQRLLKQAGPYMLIEILLPGGMLFALILYISRSGAWSALQPMPTVCQQYVQCHVLLERRAVCDLPLTTQGLSEERTADWPLGTTVAAGFGRQPPF